MYRNPPGVGLGIQNPLQLVLLRFLQGATSGTVAAATSLVAAETPRSRVGWALGVVTSAVALGGAIGPVVGGLAGDLLGLRLVFLFGGIALLLSLLPVILVVRESPQAPRSGVSRTGRRHGPTPTLDTLAASINAREPHAVRPGVSETERQSATTGAGASTASR